MMPALLLFACASDVGPPPSEVRDTGTFVPPPPCEQHPCVPDLAVATWLGEGYVGATLAVGTGHLYLGAPVYGDDPTLPRVHVARLPDLARNGSWTGRAYDLTGLALDTADIDGDGVAELAVGRPASGTYNRGSVVHILPATADGDVPIQDAALLTMIGDPPIPDGGSVLLGGSLTFAADGTEVWVTGRRQDGTDHRVLAFETSSRGEIGEGAAIRAVRSDDSLGYLEAWDGDGDGDEDLVVQMDEGPAFFESPWGEVTGDDRRAEWTDPCAHECGIAQVLETLGDVTGDGGPDLGFSAPTHPEPAHRAGRAYVLDSAGQPGPAAAIPRQVHGVEEGDGMGFALAGADVDGDGQQDLVISASGVYPSPQPGVLLVYRGPIRPGILTEAEADAKVYGEHGYDLFVRAIAVVDVDGDAQDDLAVGAPAYPAGQADGAVYLLPGAALMP